MLSEFYGFLILQFFPGLFRCDVITTGLIVTRADSHGIIPTLPHYPSHIIFFRSVNGFFTSHHYDEVWMMVMFWPEPHNQNSAATGSEPQQLINQLMTGRAGPVIQPYTKISKE